LGKNSFELRAATTGALLQIQPNKNHPKGYLTEVKLDLYFLGVMEILHI